MPCLCEFLISSYQEMWWVGPDGDHAPSSSNRTQHKRKQKMKEKVSLWIHKQFCKFGSQLLNQFFCFKFLVAQKNFMRSSMLFYITIFQTLQQHQQLVERLRTMLVDASCSSSVTLDVLHFFLEKLTHPQLTSRHLALRVSKIEHAKCNSHKIIDCLTPLCVYSIFLLTFTFWLICHRHTH